jgi:hypothetical protein
LVTSDGIYLQTEANEWIFRTANADFCHSLFNLKPVAEAVLDRDGRLVIGYLEPIVARMKENKWEYIQWNHPVLSLVKTDIGIVVGDSGGSIGLIKNQGKAAASRTVQEPIINIINIDDEKLVLLGTEGGLWTTEWPFNRDAQVKSMNNIKNLERIFGLAESNTASGVILLGADRMAFLDTGPGTIKAVSSPLEGGIRSVYANRGKTGGYAVLTNEGKLFLLSEDLKMAHMMKISIDEGQMTGVRPLPTGGFLAWTTEGNLYRVMENNTFNRIASNNVDLAFPDKDGLGIYIVRWNADEGVHIQFEHKGFKGYDNGTGKKPSGRVKAVSGGVKNKLVN